MAIPDYQSCMPPFLHFYSDSQKHTFREAVEVLAKGFKLTDQERKEMLPSGQQEVFDIRIGWARTYLKKAGLVETTKRGVNKVTRRGLEVPKEKPQKIDVNFLARFDEFQELRPLRHPKPGEDDLETQSNDKTPGRVTRWYSIAPTGQRHCTEVV